MTITRIPGTRFVKALTRIGHRPYVLIRNSLLSRKNSRRCAAAGEAGRRPCPMRARSTLRAGGLPPRSMRLRRPPSAGAKPITARTRSRPRCTRSAATVPSSPPISTRRPRGRTGSRRRTARSRAGSTSPSTPSARCSTRTIVDKRRRAQGDFIRGDGRAGAAAREFQSMAHVSVTINGRQYRMACEDGQENHLVWLAGDLDRRIEQLRAQFGEIGDMRLTMMAALTIADELVEAGKRLRRFEEDLAALQDARVVAAERSQATQAAIAAALNSAAERIERVIKGLNRSLGEGVALG